MKSFWTQVTLNIITGILQDEEVGYLKYRDTGKNIKIVSE